MKEFMIVYICKTKNPYKFHYKSFMILRFTIKSVEDLQKYRDQTRARKTKKKNNTHYIFVCNNKEERGALKSAVKLGWSSKLRKGYSVQIIQTENYNF